jgi:hypothetical protein
LTKMLSTQQIYCLLLALCLVVRQKADGDLNDFPIDWIDYSGKSMVFISGWPQSGTSFVLQMLHSIRTKLISTMIDGCPGRMRYRKCAAFNFEGQWILGAGKHPRIIRTSLREYLPGMMTPCKNSSTTAAVLKTAISNPNPADIRTNAALGDAAAIAMMCKRCGPQRATDAAAVNVSCPACCPASNSTTSLFRLQWSKSWNFDAPVLVQKSPQDMLKIPLLRSIFGVGPGSAARVRFLVVLKHPVTLNTALPRHHQWTRVAELPPKGAAPSESQPDRVLRKATNNEQIEHFRNLAHFLANDRQNPFNLTFEYLTKKQPESNFQGKDKENGKSKNRRRLFTPKMKVKSHNGVELVHSLGWLSAVEQLETQLRSMSPFQAEAEVAVVRYEDFLEPLPLCLSIMQFVFGPSKHEKQAEELLQELAQEEDQEQKAQENTKKKMKKKRKIQEAREKRMQGRTQELKLKIERELVLRDVLRTARELCQSHFSATAVEKKRWHQRKWYETTTRTKRARRSSNLMDKRGIPSDSYRRLTVGNASFDLCTQEEQKREWEEQEVSMMDKASRKLRLKAHIRKRGERSLHNGLIFEPDVVQASTTGRWNDYQVAISTTRLTPLSPQDGKQQTTKTKSKAEHGWDALENGDALRASLTQRLARLGYALSPKDARASLQGLQTGRVRPEVQAAARAGKDGEQESALDWLDVLRFAGAASGATTSR